MTLRLPATLDAPSCVRAVLRQELSRSATGALDDALLLATEVTTNAVVHGRAGGTVTVVIDWDGDAIALAIGDEGDAPPNIGPDPATDAGLDESGRGLRLLDALAEDWGIRPASTPPGKVVWFRISTAQR